MDLKKTLKEARLRAGLSLKQASELTADIAAELGAEDLAVSKEVIIAIERPSGGTENPKINDIYLICKAYNIDFADTIRRGLDPRLENEC